MKTLSTQQIAHHLKISQQISDLNLDVTPPTLLELKNRENAWNEFFYNCCVKGYTAVIQILLLNPILEINFNYRDGEHKNHILEFLAYAYSAANTAPELKNKYLEIATLLLEQEKMDFSRPENAVIWSSPLLHSSKNDDLQFFNLLLEKQVDINEISTARIRNKKGDVPLNVSALEIALVSSQVEKARCLIEHPALDLKYLNNTGSSYLHIVIAAQLPAEQSIQLIKILANKAPALLTSRNYNQYSVFTLACLRSENYLDEIKWLYSQIKLEDITSNDLEIIIADAPAPIIEYILTQKKLTTKITEVLNTLFVPTDRSKHFDLINEKKRILYGFLKNSTTLQVLKQKNTPEKKRFLILTLGLLARTEMNTANQNTGMVYAKEKLIKEAEILGAQCYDLIFKEEIPTNFNSKVTLCGLTPLLFTYHIENKVLFEKIFSRYKNYAQGKEETAELHKLLKMAEDRKDTITIEKIKKAWEDKNTHQNIIKVFDEDQKRKQSTKILVKESSNQDIKKNQKNPPIPKDNEAIPPQINSAAPEPKLEENISKDNSNQINDEIGIDCSKQENDNITCSKTYEKNLKNNHKKLSIIKQQTIYNGIDFSENLNFEHEYDPDFCLALLNVIENKGNFLFVIFNDAKDSNTETFKYQLMAFIKMTVNYNQPGIFIAKAPGAENHFICGVFWREHLLLINPLGNKYGMEHAPFEALKEVDILEKVYVATNIIQNGELEKNLVSCGPLSLEIACHILQKSFQEFESLWQELSINNLQKLFYFPVDITKWLPDNLIRLEKTNEAINYKKIIKNIRQVHYDQFIRLITIKANSQEMPASEYFNQYINDSLLQQEFTTQSFAQQEKAQEIPTFPRKPHKNSENLVVSRN